MSNSLALDSGFPYNENQRNLHIPEEKILEDLKKKMAIENIPKNKQKHWWAVQMNRLEEIKNQDPHPAKVFAPFPYCFWDTDVYWLHWEHQKKYIIPRMERAYGASFGEDPFDEQIQIKYAKKSIDFMERYYSKEDIIDVLKNTGELVDPLIYEVIADRYGLKEFKNHNWQ